MATKNPNTIEIEGITLSVDPDILDDWDIVEAVSDSNNPDLTDNERLIATTQLMRSVLGDDYKQAKTELRKKHKGKLTIETMSKFLAQVFEAVRAKNS